MTMKRKGQSVQSFLGIQSFTRYGLKTKNQELLFFKVAPVNISVLSEMNTEEKIRNLSALLSAVPGLEIVCTDAAECFDTNLLHLSLLEEQEENEKVRELLREERKLLEDLQAEMISARQFLMVRRIRNMPEEQVFHEVNKTAKAISDQKFEVTPMDKGEIKRLAGVYFGACTFGEQIPDVDGVQHLGGGTNEIL